MDPSTTFADLGMPFPLFLAPTSCAIVDGAGPCGVCGREAKTRFASTCYECFRSGLSDHLLDTELGMVRKEDAEKGLTHGLPLSSPRELPGWEQRDLVPHPVDPRFPDDMWYSVKVESGWLKELIRTPGYHSWQGERWLFCCRQPCAFLGDLDLAGLVTDDVADLLEVPAAEVRWWIEAIRNGSVASYSFRCLKCGRGRAYTDNS